MGILNEISEALQAGDQNKVQEDIKKALDDGIGADKILDEGLMAGMSIIGNKFKNNEVYVPEVLIAARAMNKGMVILKPKLVEIGKENIGIAVIGTVKGDLHDIGKNLVRMMLEGADFNVVDIGTDVSPEDFVKSVKENEADVLGLSALLTTTMPEMENVINALEEEGIRDQVKVMIGGAPVTQNFSDEIGADGYAKDAASASDLAKELL